MPNHADPARGVPIEPVLVLPSLTSDDPLTSAVMEALTTPLVDDAQGWRHPVPLTLRIIDSGQPPRPSAADAGPVDS